VFHFIVPSARVHIHKTQMGKKKTTASLYDILSIVSAYSLWPCQHPI